MIETRRGDTPEQADSPKVALDTNESPLGTPRLGLEKAMASMNDLHRYPRGALDEVIGLVAETWQVDRHCVVVTNGLDESIDLLISLVDRTWCLSPGFEPYWTRPEAAGKLVTRIPLDDAGQPRVPASKIGPEGVAFIIRPNNPTGSVVDEAWIWELLDCVELVCVDETYIGFSAHSAFTEKIGQQPNLCVFRSLSKEFGLAGVRVGVILAPPLLAARLRERQRFYGADTISLAVSAAAMRDDEYRRAHRDYIIQGRADLVSLLAGDPRFIEVRDTEASFVVARCPDPGSAIAVESELAAHGVLVRECSLFGWPSWLRISVGTPDEHARLRDVLAAGHAEKANEEK
ncbi:histidinol-phosphate transaminase [Sphaerisporangium sp. B11E5]|uniref:pyridoxal phosphate-dependent aminotransferase n=1 Tax=Sphaerisporangium sp. B11E5 TaxID=3153563 RepID=UPI00325C3938